MISYPWPVFWEVAEEPSAASLLSGLFRLSETSLGFHSTGPAPLCVTSCPRAGTSSPSVQRACLRGGAASRQLGDEGQVRVDGSYCNQILNWLRALSKLKSLQAENLQRESLSQWQPQENCHPVKSFTAFCVSSKYVSSRTKLLERGIGMGGRDEFSVVK